MSLSSPMCLFTMLIPKTASESPPLERKVAEDGAELVYYNG